MATRKYIQICSDYRDRNRYPTVSSFEVPLEQTGPNTTINTAIDPIALSYPIYQFEGNSIARGPEVFNGGTAANPILNTSASNIDNYYNGYQITDVTTHESRTIIGYSGSLQRLTLDRPFSTVTNPFNPVYGVWSASNTYTIQDNSNCSSAKNISGTISAISTNILTPTFSTPGSLQNGFYNGMIVEITSGAANGEFRKIIDYDATTQKLLIETNIPGLLVGDSFDITPNTYEGAYTVHLQPLDSLTLTPPSRLNQYYTYFFLYDDLTHEVAKIVKYDATLRTATLDSFFSNAWAVNDNYSIRESEADEVYTEWKSPPPNPGPNFSTVQLEPIGPVTVDYTGHYLFPRESTAVYRILTHDLLNNIVTVTPNPTGEFGTTPPANPHYDILPFSEDNVNGLTYTGSTVSQNQAVCYEIGLHILILPNVPLKTGTRIAFYPYVFVEFRNVSDPNSGGRNFIYSNNPNCNRALFVAAVTDTVNLESSSFLKLYSGGMTQTIKFKPNDNFYFSVYLPDGSPFDPVESDSLSPQPPKRELQLSAIFSIKRL
jgi:hypothetical protein